MKLPWFVRLDRWIRHNIEVYRRIKEVIALVVCVSITLMFVATPPETFLLTGMAVLTIAGAGIFTLYSVELAREALQAVSDNRLENGGQ